MRKGLVKARWCIRGYLDPDILELETAAPTLSPEGLAVALQVLATKRWELCIGDVEAAFLRGDNIQRSKGQVLVKPPPGGIPGLPEGAIIELLKPVYGLADAPKAWHDSFTKALHEIGCKSSQLDRCVYLCRSECGNLQGIIALHVDDMLSGGTPWFHEPVLKRLREMFPFKHFKKREGEFLGRHLRQDKEFAIHVSQKEYSESLECLKLSRERRRQREAAVSEDERKQMRAVLGELNWLVSSSRPDLAAHCSLLQQRVNQAWVKDLVEVNRAVAMARDFACIEVIVRHIPEQEVEFCVWSDASWANATEKKSQGGYVIAAVHSSLRKGAWAVCSPLRWKSYLGRRATCSFQSNGRSQMGRITLGRSNQPQLLAADQPQMDGADPYHCRAGLETGLRPHQGPGDDYPRQEAGHRNAAGETRCGIRQCGDKMGPHVPDDGGQLDQMQWTSRTTSTNLQGGQNRAD